MIKRAIDIILAIIILPLFLIFFIIMGIAIKMDSSGPIIYLDKRIGEKGKIINMYKFRTMTNKKVKIEEFNKEFKLKRDPRITRIGRFLRRTSMDELPQIINILKGEMSLVGPRPILIQELEYYPKKDFRVYSSVKPGLTGLWQVSGRNNLAYKKRIELNTFYIRNISFPLDLKIMFKTMSIIISGKGAY